MNLAKFLLSLLVLNFIGFTSQAAESSLVIATYDSLVAKDGLAEVVIPAFEKKYGVKIKTLAAGDGGQVLSRLELDAKRGKNLAQIVWGLDQNLWKRALPLIEPWQKWKPDRLAELQSDARELSKQNFLVYDYGVFAWIVDTQEWNRSKLPLPKSLKDFTDAKLNKKFILEDPRTSTPGLAFLVASQQIFGSDNKSFTSFWQSLHSNWLTLPSSWDAAYGIFLKQEAPLVWSYTTSQAYHRAHDDKNNRYQALALQEASPLQLEGAGLIKNSFRNSEQRKLAENFMNFLLSDEVQKQIPERNWMFPSITKTGLPLSFKDLPSPKTLPAIQPSSQELAALIKEWEKIVSN